MDLENACETLLNTRDQENTVNDIYTKIMLNMLNLSVNSL